MNAPIHMRDQANKWYGFVLGICCTMIVLALVTLAVFWLVVCVVMA